MSSSINDQVRRTVLNHCFQRVRKGTEAESATWDALLDHFNIQAPPVSETTTIAASTSSIVSLTPPSLLIQQQQGDATTPPPQSSSLSHNNGSAPSLSSPPTSTATATTITTSTAHRERTQRIGRKLSQIANKVYGLSIGALNGPELFFVCVVLELDTFTLPTPLPTPSSATIIAGNTEEKVELYMDEVPEEIAVAPSAPPVAAPVVGIATPVIKLPSKRALQVVLESFHYSKNPLPQRVRRLPEVFVADPLPFKTPKKIVAKKVVATALSPPAAAAGPSALGVKRERPEKPAKSETTIKGKKPKTVPLTATSTTGSSTKGNTTNKLLHSAAAAPIAAPSPRHVLDLSANLFADSSSCDSTTPSDNEGEDVTAVDGGGDGSGVVDVDGLVVEGDDVFDFKVKGGISALAEGGGFDEDEMDEEDNSLEGRRNLKQKQLIQALRLEGMLTLDIALKVLNGSKGGSKKKKIVADGDAPATVEDVRGLFNDIIQRGFALCEFDTLFFVA